MSIKAMERIAITGNLASGKSVVGQIIKKMNYPVIEADEVVNKLYETKELKDLLQDRYQLAVFRKDGKIDKNFLRKLIFNNHHERKYLEMIIWPRVWSYLEIWQYSQEKKGESKTFVIVPLLFEANWQDKFDKIWLVYSRPQDRLERAQIKRGINQDLARKILSSQIPDEKKRSKVDVIINNYDTIAELKQNVKNILA